MDKDTARKAGGSSDERPEYDPPQVERVLSRDELAREMHYAGTTDPSSGAIG
jgi:hypothetical protein